MSDSSDAVPRRRSPASPAVVGLLTVLTVTTWPVGGLRANVHRPATVAPGRIVDQGLFRVQIIDARAGRMKLHPYEPATNLLIVRMRVTEVGDRSFGISTFLGGITAEPKAGRYAEPDVMRSQGVIGGKETSTVHPRLPLIVRATWQLPDGAAPPSVTVALRTWAYDQSFTTDTFDWSVTPHSPITATVAVPVRTGATR